MLISLVIILIPIARLFKDFTQAICHADLPLSGMVHLISRAQNIRSSLKCWYSTNFGSCGPPDNIRSLGDGYYKLLILFYLCSLYSNRLNTCIFWAGTSDIEDIEDESQEIAKTIVSFSKDEAYSTLRSSLILAQKLPIAEATVETGVDWRGQLRRGSGPGQLFKIQERVFRHWCSLFGRKTS